jgi:RNA polymerase sigma factor (sigma-70 family)
VLRKQSDTRLTDLARAGSEPAFEAIVARYRSSLVRYCASVVGEGDAEEVVQDALLKAHAALLRGDPIRRLSPWLHVVAYNTALSYLRARSSRPQATEADYDWCATMDSSAEHRQELGEVLDAVRSLPDRQRDAIVMRELEGRSYDEIAARLGSSPAAVRQLLYRARTSVRERVAALLPLEPLVRWAFSGAGGADAGAGAGLSGACVVGAKACAALLLPATIAVVASSPAPRAKTTTVATSRPAATATYAARARTVALVPASTSTSVAVDAALTARRAAARIVRYSGRFTADPRSGLASRVVRTPLRASSSTPLDAGHSTEPSPAAASAQPVLPRQSSTQAAGHQAPVAEPQPNAGQGASPASGAASGAAGAGDAAAATAAAAAGAGGAAGHPSGSPAPSGSHGGQATMATQAQ